MWSLFENPVTVHEYIQVEIALVVTPQIQLRTKHITIKYNHLQSFVAEFDVLIKQIDAKEHITDIFTNNLDSELFGYPCYKINSI